MKDIKYVVEIDTGAVCRVVCYCDVDYVYIIKVIVGGGRHWNDCEYHGVKVSEIRELTEDELQSFGKEFLLEKSKNPMY